MTQIKMRKLTQSYQIGIQQITFYFYKSYLRKFVLFAVFACFWYSRLFTFKSFGLAI